jgi:hypothetical protein
MIPDSNNAQNLKIFLLKLRIVVVAQASVATVA